MSMLSMLAASQSMLKMQAMQSARGQMGGAANVLRIESKQDGGNKEKEAKADALDEKNNGLMGDLLEEVKDVNETIEAEEKKEAEEAAKEKAEEKKKAQTDTLELSAQHPQNLGQLPQAQPVTLEAVTYDATGGTTPSVPPAAPAQFEATA